MLLNNGFSRTVASRFFGATVVSGANPSSLERTTLRAGTRRNLLAGGGIPKVASVPVGYRHPSAWIMAAGSGGMSSREGGLTITTTGNGAMGVAAAGTTSFAINFLTASGELISAGTGSASFLISANGATTAAFNATGTAALLITTSGAVIAKGWFSNSTATFTIDGSLVAYANGYMTGTTEDSTILTTDAITASVWNAIATNYNASGTMGQKLNNAAAGGVDYNALAAAVWAAAIEDGHDAAEMLRLIMAPIAGDMEIVSPTQRAFKSMDGSKNRLVADVIDGERDTTYLDGT